MDKVLILSKIQNHYGFKKDTDFAEFLGIQPQVLSKWKSRNSFDAELICTKCTDISAEFILIGKGEILRNKKINEGIKYKIENKSVPSQNENISENQSFSSLLKTIDYFISKVDLLEKELEIERSKNKRN